MSRGAHRLTLLAPISVRLREQGIPFAVIGAVAMAVHGIARGTRDLDLLALAPECLTAATWEPLRRIGITVEIRRGDVDDPLAGVAGFSGEAPSTLDLVVGRSPWQAEILTRARETAVEGTLVPVVTAADLILLRLYAGGPQDAWDIEQLLASGNRAALVDDVERGLLALPASGRNLWQRVVGRSGERT